MNKPARKAVSSVLIAGLMTSILSTGMIGAGTQSASAQGFFERLFNPKYQRMQELRSQEELQRKVKQVRVSSPRFYTYKPDVWKNVSLKDLAHVKTAAVSPAATADGQAVAADAAPAVESDFDKARAALNDLKFKMLPEVADAIEAYYREHPNFLWIENGNVDSRALSAKMALAAADKEGLNPQDYEVALPDYVKVPEKTAAVEAVPVETAVAPAAASAPSSEAAETAPVEEAVAADGAAQTFIENVPTEQSVSDATPATAEDGNGTAQAYIENIPTEQSVSDAAAPDETATETTASVGTATAGNAAPVTAEAAAPAETAAPEAAAPVETAAAPEIELSPERAKELMAYEIEFSSAVLTYVLDAKRGRVDPDRISGYHDLPRHKVDLVAVLEDIRNKDDLEAYLVSENPQNAHYKALKGELARLRAEDEEADQIVIAPGTFLKAGKSSPEMKNIVAAIRKNGSAELKEKNADTLTAYAGEELYTPELVALVKDFQKENKLGADGIVGKNTIRAMVGETNAAKIAKVRLAMERSRWIPEDLGARRVFVNQPAYTATYYAPGEKPFSMRVVVGKKSNQTSFFYDKIELVEYNPYWGVPYSIIVNEMLPKLARDPSYLDRSGYEVTTTSGRQVSSSSVDWYAVASKQTSINVRQYPGRSNALGLVKILFPNKHHIYMHDTPSKGLFKRDARAFSHGCIRLQDPQGMAAKVLGKSKDYVAGRIAQGQNQQEHLKQEIPVYISYFTAWPDANGTIKYYDDVYSRDRYLLKALDMTENTRKDARV